MNPDQWHRVKEILDEVLTRPAAERRSFLHTACAGDEALEREIESFLDLEADLGDFIEEPIFDLHDGEAPGSLTGSRIGPYRVVGEVGRGGMGAVYLGERADQEFDRQVAIKLLKRGLDTEELLRRFRAERRILARFDHPNIARLIDAGSLEDGRPYLIMELVEGEPIDAYCQAHGLGTRERLALFVKLCHAVQFAHRNLVVHRDLKPSNVLVTAEGEPKLLDFGIARLLDPTAMPGFTGGVSVMPLRLMTLEYASPEQVRGLPVTTSTDVYSLGVLLFKLLTARLPYKVGEGDRRELERAIVEVPARRASTAVLGAAEGASSEVDRKALARQLGGDLDNVVAMALEKEPERRYSSADQLAADVQAYLDGLPVAARKGNRFYRAGKFVKRNKGVVAATLATFAVISGFAWQTKVALGDSERERARAGAVTQFLVNLTEQADPRKSGAKDETVRSLLNKQKEQLLEGLEDQPVTKAELLATLGKTFTNLGDLDSAEPLLKDALALRESALGPDHPLVAWSLHHLAALYWAKGDSSNAEPLLRKALDIQRRAGLTEDPDYLKGTRNLAILLMKSPRKAEAKPLLDEALERDRRPEAVPSELALTLNSLGIWFQWNGEPARAEAAFREALAIRRGLTAEPSVDTATSANALAALLETLDRGKEAEKLYREALAIRQAIYPGGHIQVATVLNNLGDLIEGRGDLQDAEMYYRRALAEVARAKQETHPNAGIITANLARILVARSDRSCEPVASQAVAMLKEQKQERPVLEKAQAVLSACLALQPGVSSAAQ